MVGVVTSRGFSLVIGVPGGRDGHRLAGNCHVHHNTVSRGVPLVAGTHLTDTFVRTFYRLGLDSVRVGD